MHSRQMRRGLILAGLLLGVSTIWAAGKVEGTFVVGGSDGKLQFVRAVKTTLDEKGKTGYAVLISSREAKGDIRQWKTADPKERGSFIYMELESSGAVWIAQLAHASAKSGNFGVVTEVRTTGFKAQGNQLTFGLTSGGEQQFTDDKYTVNLKIEAALEP